MKGLGALGYAAATMPPDTFKGQTQPVPTVGFPTVLITNAALPEPIAYTITKTVDREQGRARPRPRRARRVRAARRRGSPRRSALPLHPGAERAYREKGWMK